ncbi:MAG: hypothetical protein Fur002_07970 [Anaerolineales bacterium]
MKTFSSTLTHPRGQSLAEFAISLLVLLLLLTGAIETSLALFQYVTLRDASQEGALYGSIKPTDVAGIQANAVAAGNDVLKDLTTDQVQVTIIDDGTELSVADAIEAKVACEGATNNSPHAVRVFIQFDHPVTFPFVSAMIGKDTITLRASATNTILQPACAP